MSKKPGMKFLRIEISYTTREYHSLNLYFNDLARIGLLDEEEEALLCKRIREGDESAIDRLVKGNLRFVISCAKKYERMGLPIGDLINEGNLGLIAAARKFDVTLGFKFISYAVYWIRQSMMLALGEHARMVRLPMNQVRNITVAHQLMGELEQKLERSATIEELAKGMGVPVHQLSEQLLADRIPLSIYQPQGDEDGGREVGDSIADELLPPSDYLTELSDQRNLTELLLSGLNHKERTVIEGLYGIGQPMYCSHEVMAGRVNLTTERIKQIEKSAIHKLKVIALERGLSGV
ncbi:RNA polymerase sigma factor RpoD/SigA [Pedobacter sp. KBW01]|uniref:sigma-70 family RNA polymerase sigma factor n=1 Tax=Pedobacter sp. KBW01 TaxID=2153364 RepID=UPI001319B9BA|nr:sigma-70 family RNA polymerase sigma factor [Pedobacter sp. KBW01]